MKIKTFSFIIGFILLSILSYGQIDSLEYRDIYSWKLNPYDLSLEYTDIDTSLNGFQQYNPLLKKTITATYLGNLGSPAKSNIYYDREKREGFIFSQPYHIYFHHHDNQHYFNTKKRYTLLNYSNAGQKNESEQLLGVFHTQNVTENFNVGIDYDMISSDGRYQQQQVRQSIIKLFSSYNAKRYRLHLNYYLNRNKSQLNGGIDSLSYLGSDEYNNRQNIPVRLNNARNQVFSSGLYLAHEYHFGEKQIIYKQKSDSSNSLNRNDKNPSDSSLYKGTKEVNVNDTSAIQSNDTTDNSSASDGVFNDKGSVNGKNEKQDGAVDTIEVINYSGFSLSHELFYTSDVRKFFDDDLTESFYSEMDKFIDSSKTHDEVRQKRFANNISLHYRYKNTFSSRLSFYNERMNYKYNKIPDTTFVSLYPIQDSIMYAKRNVPIHDTIIDANREAFESNSRVAFYAKAFLFNHLLFQGYTEYFFSGYKKDNSTTDLKLGYTLFKSINFNLKAKYKTENPVFFYREYTSNHFKWDNDSLQMEDKFDIGFEVQSSKYRLNTFLRYSQLKNYIYLDSTASINQYSNPLNIVSAGISKKITLGPIHSTTRFVYQKSSNDSVLALPEFNLYQSLYYEKLLHFKSTGGNLLLQIGVDYRYASGFYADDFMPQTGMFYRQFEQKMDNYHRFDVFVNFTLKRTRFYIQYSYLNSALNENYYFNAPFYPSPEPVFKYGIAWSFYD